MELSVETSGLRKAYGSRRAVDGIDLAVPAGSVTGFLGPNGAGKTTTIRMLLGLLRPDSGRISIHGLEMPRARREIARRTGSLVETPCHYDNLTGRENLEVSRRLLGLPRPETDRVLELMDLAHAAAQRVGTYSLGMRQRLGVARALLGRPRLLILDEPTNGLDPDGIVELRQLIRALPRKDGTTVLLSSHLLAEVEQTVDHVILIHGGRLLAQGPLPHILARSAPRLLLQVDRPEAAAGLLAAQGIASIRREPACLEVPDPPGCPSAINSLLVGNGVAVSQLVYEQPSLEAVYMALTEASAPIAEAA